MVSIHTLSIEELRLAIAKFENKKVKVESITVPMNEEYVNGDCLCQGFYADVIVDNVKLKMSYEWCTEEGRITTSMVDCPSK